MISQKIDLRYFKIIKPKRIEIEKANCFTRSLNLYFIEVDSLIFYGKGIINKFYMIPLLPHNILKSLIYCMGIGQIISRATRVRRESNYLLLSNRRNPWRWRLNSFTWSYCPPLAYELRLKWIRKGKINIKIYTAII